MITLKCPNCGAELRKEEGRWVCPNGHSFDIAKKDYVNLILANQGRHLDEGDSKEMIQARRDFLSKGYYGFLRDKLTEVIEGLCKEGQTNFADIACGEGYYTNFIHSRISSTHAIKTVGLDISKSAIQACASSRNALNLKGIEYVVGNLDYLPLLDGSQDILLNCFAPINPSEFSRVLKKGGYYIRVLPDKEHLLGLKSAIYETVKLNEEKDESIDGFELVEEIHLSRDTTIDGQDLPSLFMMTPYFYKSPHDSLAKLSRLENLDTHIGFLLLVYKSLISV